VTYRNLIIVFGCLAGKGVAAGSNISIKLLEVFKEMADKEDGSFVLPGNLKTWVPGNGGEILDLCQDELRLGFIGYPKPVSDLPLDL
jgi:hypothetical protein